MAEPCDVCRDGSCHDPFDCPTLMLAHGGETTFWGDMPEGREENDDDE